MSTTNAMIIDWARDKGILGGATALDQVLKTIEELGELAGGVSKGNRDVQIDSLGDVYVTLVIINEIMGLGDLPEVGKFELYEDEFENPKRWVAMISSIVGVLSDLADDCALNMPFDENDAYELTVSGCRSLRNLAEHLGFTLQQCVDHAYGIISKRSGEMVDGVFVKAEIDSSETPLTELAWQAYQVIGALTCDLADDPEHVRALDYFSEVANGDRAVDEDFLPFAPAAQAAEEVTGGAV